MVRPTVTGDEGESIGGLAAVVRLLLLPLLVRLLPGLDDLDAAVDAVAEDAAAATAADGSGVRGFPKHHMCVGPAPMEVI